MAGGVLSLGLVTLILVLPDWDPLSFAEYEATRLAHYALVTTLLGTWTAFAWPNDARLAAAGTALALLAAALAGAGFLFPDSTVPFTQPIYGLNVGLTVIAATSPLVAGVEYGARDRATAREILTPRAVTVGGALGVLNLLVVAYLNHEAGYLGVSVHHPFSVLLALWVYGGSFLAGATAGVLLGRYRLLLPLLVCLGTFLWSLPGYLLYAIGWYLVVLLALGAGFLEHTSKNLLRPLLSVVSPRS